MKFERDRSHWDAGNSVHRPAGEGPAPADSDPYGDIDAAVRRLEDLADSEDRVTGAADESDPSSREEDAAEASRKPREKLRPKRAPRSLSELAREGSRSVWGRDAVPGPSALRLASAQPQATQIPKRTHARPLHPGLVDRPLSPMKPSHGADALHADAPLPEQGVQSAKEQIEAPATEPVSERSETLAPEAEQLGKAEADPSEADTGEPDTVMTATPEVEQEVQPQPQARSTQTPGPEARKTEETEPQARKTPHIAPLIEGEKGPLNSVEKARGGSNGGRPTPPSGGGGGGGPTGFHKRAEMPNFSEAYHKGLVAVRRNIVVVMIFTLVINVLVLAIPVYLFQISDRVLTSRSLDTLIMLTLFVIGAILLQAVLDAIRRFVLMRTAVEVEVQLGAPILAAAARSSLSGSTRDYQVLGDLQQLRSFITSGTLLAILDAPLAPLFVLAVFLIHPNLGYIVVAAAFGLLIIAVINQRLTAKHFADSNAFVSRAALHVDSMSRNSQIINALAMIPEAVRIWGRDTAFSLTAQVRAQDRNIIMATMSKLTRLITQVTMLGWGAYLALEGQMTGGMVIAGSIIAARALTPIEGAIEGWHSFTQFRSSFQRIRNLLQTSPFNFERLLLPDPQGRLDVERILFVPPPNKKVILNGISFSLMPGESLAVIGNSGAGKTTLGKMLVGSILPTSGSVRLDMMDLRNWDQRQFGENIGYLPQDVQLFPGTIKANIARMREDVDDKQIFEAAVLADCHELIASFPQGYETFVAADGAPLSGGQKQRIALARAFFGDPKLVVLDEPNSNLDSLGEVALAKAIQQARQRKITVVTITQRTSLLNVVDKILVLSNGSVSMFGARSEVLKAITADKAGNKPNGGVGRIGPQEGE